MPRAVDLGLISCHVCGLVCRAASVDADLDGEVACPRCSSALHRRKPASYTRTWALLIAAFLMYIPANVLPIMRTASLKTSLPRMRR